ncbi:MULTISPECIES: gamma-aminobutyraldehyde dehydrogenase [Mycolicibacterium]|uniref:Gamma-aminobutyraldehyde dehydrogenase n=1 Tax=Mycolicibacterium mageritense TaxID=53462 RepID=A0AAI8XIC1_MYCME|nr:gamma-aminobutyraldehyde dehydrogenase [Mycolicibacterium mageritense]MBN3455841.1 gamma-aminobutyraldehyde dehydrogenase [Mycobacterium sp. DSM 3803]OKH79216.1 phenylacetaldehyde dehydrogenase [Mycobacterium sp. SWH-M3]TXI56093.1 MAG: gamma-aminobutyraldehyde dehydrogenase [Mycolicibacterium mageritense]BDY26289.1 Gamma-aminobutyraldehyde dehydrogenase [Mycolicibacterium mageritense]GJJ16963.1 gamma-aminobutyraldehyde dehydrogenase [Mycolicibacterium mageritense]
MADKKIIHNIINGEVQAASDGEMMDIVNPSTGEVFASAPNSSAADVDQAFQAAGKAFESWRWSTPSERQRALLKLADVIEENADELIAIECENTGKPVSLTASEEIPPMLDQIRFFAGAARVLEGRSQGEYMRGHTSSIRREPVGPVAQVAPWNYPMMMSVWKFAPALAAGCTVVLKPSDTTPASSYWMVEKMQEIFPPGVCNLVCGDRDTGAALVAHPVPQLVSITGSTRAGIAVAASAAKDLKRAHLELGGKAPVVVFDDADISAVVEGITAAGYFNAGQDCTAATRMIIQDGIYDEFLAAMTESVAATKTGFDPDDEDILFGPINNPNQLAHVSGLVSRAPEHARILAGGKQKEGAGFFFEPTLIADLRQDDELIQTEIFGPVVTAQRFSTEEEALGFANGTEYGLASSVWTRNVDTAARMSARLDFGCVWINTHIPLVAEMPHGGFKHSGYGKDLSMYGLEDYTRIKHVMHYHGFEG